MNVSRNTVRKYLRDASKPASYGPRQARASKLDPYKAYLQQRIEAAKPHWIPATVLFRELQSQGYSGQEGIVRIYVRQFKTKPEVPVIRYETPPGKQMQVDFTTIRRGQHKLKAFVATLGYSRATDVRFSETERQQDWLDGIEGALQYFDGVPQTILFDNAKCILIERDAYGDGQHRWNPAVLNLSKQYGFKLRVCRPYRAQTKGNVERFNGYLKSSFITPLAATLKQAGLLLDCDMANGAIGQWLDEVAQQRIHGTTGEKPQVLLDKERPALQPLPVLPRESPATTPTRVAIPTDSIQHPLSTYDQVLEDRP